MDPRLLKHYDNELRHIRELGAEFARFPQGCRPAGTR